MQCINETLDSWPDLRRAMLFTKGDPCIEFYKRTMGMGVLPPGANGLVIMHKDGNGSPYKIA